MSFQVPTNNIGRHNHYAVLNALCRHKENTTNMGRVPGKMECLQAFFNITRANASSSSFRFTYTITHR